MSAARLQRQPQGRTSGQRCNPGVKGLSPEGVRFGLRVQGLRFEGFGV